MGECNTEGQRPKGTERGNGGVSAMGLSIKKGIIFSAPLTNRENFIETETFF